MTFELHPNLTAKIFIADLPLCRVLMEDEKHYPWFFLVPRRPNIVRLIDLDVSEQLQMMQEVDQMQRVVWEAFRPTQLNVAAIGNKTPQLHMHVIARYDNDPAWPNTVWDHPIRARYAEEQRHAVVKQMQGMLSHSK